MKKFPALIILAALTVSQFACGGTGETQGTTSDTTTAETTQAETGIVSRLTPELKSELGLDGMSSTFFCGRRASTGRCMT